MATCQHLSLGIKVDKEDLLSKSYGACSVCQRKESRLWACLQEHCHFVGCGETVQDHSTKHHKEFKHAIAINLGTFRIWCYICQREVHLPSVIVPVEMKALKKYRRQNSVHSNPRNTTERNMDYTDRRKINDERDSVNFGAVGMDTDQAGNDLDMTRGLIGLRNLGNTCYMNSALQAISNCLPLTYYFLSNEIHIDKKLSMAKNYSKLICDMWQPTRYSCIAPTGLHTTLKSINPAFRGYSQQDAQEFLRCLMDHLHEELKYPVPTWVVKQSAISNGEVEHMDVDEHNRNERINSEATSNDGTHSNRDEHITTTQRRTSNGSMAHAGGDRPQVPSVSAATPMRHSHTQLHGQDITQQSEQTAESTMEAEDLSQNVPKITENSCNNSNKSEMKSFPGKKSKNRKRSSTQYRSIISDIFDGELRSSVQCLTCDQVSHTKETFQDLSLPIPGKDDLARLHCMVTHSPASGSSAMPVVPGFKGSPCSESYTSTTYIYSSVWNVWEWLKSWVWGAQITLNDCLSAFFSADELKGDNMYSCEKCKKLRNGVKYCKLLKLPEVLCIHLKRFRHEYLMSYSSKISSAVSFPSTGLDLRPFLAQDMPSDCTNYDLCSVVVHLGNAGGGHYTTYAKNFLNNKWYEFDDQFVTQVSESTVTAAEAYVLFYCKSSVESTRARDRIYNLIQDEISKLPHDVSSSFLRFYVSLKWLHKFLTFTDPGPVDNSDFVCCHSDIQPQKYEFLDQITVPVTERLWQEIHSRFGGGPVMTRPVACRICAEEIIALEDRRVAERNMFLELNRRNRDSNLSILYINLDWFRDWEDFINAKIAECPGEINNEPICLKKDGKYVLKKHSSYASITDRAWHYLFSIYGGGPLVTMRLTNLGSTLNKPPPPSLAKTVQKHKEEREGASESSQNVVGSENRTAHEEKPSVDIKDEEI